MISAEWDELLACPRSGASVAVLGDQALLFGGFDPDFYRSYRGHWELDAGYAVRRTLYNLYHVLNHLNLFGRAYLAQAERMTAELLAEAEA